MGNKVIDMGIDIFSAKPNSLLYSNQYTEVNTFQDVDPYETAIIDRLGFNNMDGESYKAYRGQTMMHEVTESYKGGVFALTSRRSAGNANESPNEYNKAHSAATSQPNIKYNATQLRIIFKLIRGK